LMRSGGVSGCDGESRRHRERPRRGLRRADRLDRRRRQRCRQQHAADAAGINANVVAVVVRRRRSRAGGVAVTNDRRRTGGRERRGAARRPAREQPAKRQRIGGHERNHAPPQRPAGEMPVHVERFRLPGPEHRSAEQIPRPDDDARFSPACVVSATSLPPPRFAVRRTRTLPSLQSGRRKDRSIQAPCLFVIAKDANMDGEAR
jgi:hypothetical protein